ncbi:hypothetical protein [Heyndrickxia camelliae]|nr:hypothetical protein [Heyndrickxia camelliae]
MALDKIKDCGTKHGQHIIVRFFRDTKKESPKSFTDVKSSGYLLFIWVLT